MKPIRLQYLPSLAPLIVTLGERMAGLNIDCAWQCIECGMLRKQAKSADLLLVDEAFTEGDPEDILASRPVYLLLEHWDLELAFKWMNRGFTACLPLGEPEQILSHVLTYYFRKNNRHRVIEQRTSPELLQAVVDAVPLPIFYKDQSGLYLGGNREFERYIGIPVEELRGKTVYYVSPPELADVYAEADQALLRSGGTQQYEAQVSYADGSLRDVEFHKAVFYQKNGEPGGQVGVLLDITERKRLSDQLTELASTDPLTGALNLRSFHERVEREVRLVRRYRQSMSVLILDLDHFKQINDAHGHPGGDHVLLTVVDNVQALLRKEDALFRVGGEEFYILLPHTNLAEAEEVAERVRSSVERARIYYRGQSVQLTMSLGVAEIRFDETIRQCLDRADRALYRAKATGRNRVVSASP